MCVSQGKYTQYGTRTGKQRGRNAPAHERRWSGRQCCARGEGRGAPAEAASFNIHNISGKQVQQLASSKQRVVCSLQDSQGTNIKFKISGLGLVVFLGNGRAGSYSLRRGRFCTPHHQRGEERTCIRKSINERGIS